MAIVVDAFHFPTHKVTDVECNTHCNPNSFPILRKADGSWLFNSSAAEQVNSWFGKFQPKVKEMNVIRYMLFRPSLPMISTYDECPSLAGTISSWTRS